MSNENEQKLMLLLEGCLDLLENSTPTWPAKADALKKSIREVLKQTAPEPKKHPADQAYQDYCALMDIIPSHVHNNTYRHAWKSALEWAENNGPRNATTRDFRVFLEQAAKEVPSN